MLNDGMADPRPMTTHAADPAVDAAKPRIWREIVETLRPPPGSKDGMLPPLLILLTVVTGVVDAVAYLRLGHVFVANMTGNIVFLGFAAGGATVSPSTARCSRSRVSSLAASRQDGSPPIRARTASSNYVWRPSSSSLS